MMRVNADVIEFGDDYVYRMNGLPFTGVAVEYDEDGKVISELEFKDGMQHGISREWIDGVLRSEGTYRQSSKHGTQKEWAADGTLESIEEYELGICVSRSIATKDGHLKEVFRLGNEDPLCKTLETLRRVVTD